MGAPAWAYVVEVLKDRGGELDLVRISGDLEREQRAGVSQKVRGPTGTLRHRVGQPGRVLHLARAHCQDLGAGRLRTLRGLGPREASDVQRLVQYLLLAE